MKPALAARLETRMKPALAVRFATRMKPALAVRFAGWISVVAMVLLTSPGVRLVRAAEVGPISEAPAGPSCSADSLGSAVLTVALPSEEEAAQQRAKRGRPEVVSLDGGGNHYGHVDASAFPAPEAR